MCSNRPSARVQKLPPQRASDDVAARDAAHASSQGAGKGRKRVQIASIDEKAAAGQQKFIGDRNADNPEHQQPEDGEIAIGGDPLEDGAFQSAMIREYAAEQPSAFEPHSGWGAAVVVAGGPGAIDVVDRRKIVITETIQGATNRITLRRDLPDPESYSCRMRGGVGTTCLGGSARNYLRSAATPEGRLPAVRSCWPPDASCRPFRKSSRLTLSFIPPKANSFVNAFRQAGERLKLKVTGIREKDLDERSQMTFGAGADP